MLQSAKGFFLSAGAKFSGIGGNPELWLARRARVMTWPLRLGIFTVGGKYFVAGSSGRSSPWLAMSASRMPVKTFVIDPISNTVSPSTGRLLLRATVPAATILRFVPWSAPDDKTDRLFVIDALLQDLLKCGIRNNGLRFAGCHTGANYAHNETKRDDEM